MKRALLRQFYCAWKRPTCSVFAFSPLYARSARYSNSTLTGSVPGPTEKKEKGLAYVKSEFPSVPVNSRPFAEVLLEAISKHAKEQPNRPAVISAEDENDFVTYAELHQRSLSVAAFLKSMDIGQGDIVGAVLPNCWQFLATFIATAARGGALSGANHVFTESELAQQFNDSKCKIVFCSDVTLKKVLAAWKSCPDIKNIVVVPTSLEKDDMELPADVIKFSSVLETPPMSALPKVNIVVDHDLVLLPYSSGTTGLPKGVMLTHKSFGTMMNIFNFHFHNQIALKLDPNWNWKKEFQCLLLPLYHIYGIGLAVNSLLSGGCAIMLKQFDGDLFCKIMQKYKINHGLLVPPILVFLAKSPIVSKYDLSAIKFIMTGAAPAGHELIEEVMKRLPSVAQITQGYGMTEQSMASHLPVFGMKNTAAVGRLASNLEMKIVDIESRNTVCFGEVGEICVRGPTIMRGYLNRPDATAETVDQEGWLRTGDVGYHDADGWTYVVDRLKELIKVRGFQVAPAELEDVLLSNPDVRDAAVIGVNDYVSGEVPKAFVVKANLALTEKDVMKFVAARVCSYKQLKGGVEFVESIPKSPSGKILRRMLRK